jgi:hypothetical protein
MLLHNQLPQQLRHMVLIIHPERQALLRRLFPNQAILLLLLLLPTLLLQ